jgi:hypothetical protein
MDTASSEKLYLWGSVARFNHPQVYLVVTYEFDATAESDIFVSVILPSVQCNIAGGTASTDFERIQAELWIEEPGTITTKQVAFCGFWEQLATINGIYARLGEDAFTAYTDAAAQMCGGNGLSIVGNASFDLVRGKNILNVDFYRDDASNFATGLSGFFIVNYTASKPTDGYGAANHTVIYNVGFTYDADAVASRFSSPVAVSIPETEYLISNFGAVIKTLSQATANITGISLLMERTSELGQWSPIVTCTSQTDAETGLRTYYGDMTMYTKQWPVDVRPDVIFKGSRLNIEDERRYWVAHGNFSTAFVYMDLYFTYHTNTFAIAGTVTGTGGSTATVSAYRTDTGDLLGTDDTDVSGAYSIPWYDDTIDVFSATRIDATLVGRSDNGKAGT